MRLLVAIIPMALAACATAYAQAPEYAQAEAVAQPYYVRHAMQTSVNPAIVAIWDVGNNAMNENGGLDPELMGDDQWSALATAAGTLATEGERMAAAKGPILAAAPGNMATDEYEISMTDVQRLLDDDQQGFRDMGSEFAQLARMLESAAVTRDIDAAGELVGRMDVSCSVCHAQFWYAEPQ